MDKTIDMWHKVWPDPGAFVRASAQDLKAFAELVRADERKIFTAPDAITDNSESQEYKAGWNECRELTIQMRKP